MAWRDWGPSDGTAGLRTTYNVVPTAEREKIAVGWESPSAQRPAESACDGRGRGGPATPLRAHRGLTRRRLAQPTPTHLTPLPPPSPPPSPLDASPPPPSPSRAPRAGRPRPRAPRTA